MQQDAAIDDVHLHGQTVEWHIAAEDFGPAIFQVDVRREKFRQADHRGGQKPRTGLGARHRLALLGGLVGRVQAPGLGADEATEIGEIDLAGRDNGIHHRAVLPGKDFQISLHITRPEFACEIVEVDLAVGIVQIAFELIRRSFRKRDANQRQQQFHIRAGQLQLEVHSGKIKGVLHSPDQAGVRRPVLQLQIDRIRGGRVAQCQQTAADKICRDGLAGIGPGCMRHDLWGAVRFMRGYRHVEVGVQPFQHRMSLAVEDAQIAQLGARLARAGRQGRKQIIGAAVIFLGGRQFRPIDENIRDDQRSVPQQLHRVDGYGQLLNLGEGRVLREPVGIGDLHTVRDHHDVFSKRQRKMAKGDFAPQCGRSLPRDHRAEPIPVPSHQYADGNEHGSEQKRPPPASSKRNGLDRLGIGHFGLSWRRCHWFPISDGCFQVVR